MYLVKIDSLGNGALPENTQGDYELTICPNPFTQNTVIKFDVPLDAAYTLQLFDAQGKDLGRKSGIAHDVIFIERNDLPAGAYFFQIISGNRVIGKGKIIAL